MIYIVVWQKEMLFWKPDFREWITILFAHWNNGEGMDQEKSKRSMLK